MAPHTQSSIPFSSTKLAPEFRTALPVFCQFNLRHPEICRNYRSKRQRIGKRWIGKATKARKKIGDVGHSPDHAVASKCQPITFLRLAHIVATPAIEKDPHQFSPKLASGCDQEICETPLEKSRMNRPFLDESFED